MRRASLLLWTMALPFLTGAARPHRHPRARPAPKVETQRARELISQTAELCLRTGRFDRAVALYDRARALRPRSAELLEDLIEACRHAESCRGRRVSLLDEAVRTLPRGSEYLDDLVELLTQSGRASEAIERLRAHLATHGSDRPARRTLVETLVAHERKAEALVEVREALRLGQEPDLRVREVELLGELHMTAERDRALDALAREQPALFGTWSLQVSRDLEREQLSRARTDLAQAAARASTEEERAELAELRRDLENTEHEHEAEFRSDVRWSDFIDDLGQEQDRAP